MKIHNILRRKFGFQRRRMQQFAHLFAVGAETTILDVGGYFSYWLYLDNAPRVTLLNTHPPQRNIPPRFATTVGDGRALTYGDGAFDIAFSNSVIEHVGDFAQQRRFANELRRVGRSYYVQVPYRWSVVEPHFIVPLLHWLPKPAFKWLAYWLSPWRWSVKADRQWVNRQVDSIHLLTIRQMRDLFPDASIHRERVFGFTKSLLAIKMADHRQQ
jgi:hypothetical protein